MGLDVKKVKERMDNKGKERGDRWKPATGDNPIRVLPHTLKYFTDTVDDLAYSYLIHFNVGPEGSKEAVICPKTANRKNRCPVCELIGILKKGDPRDQSLASDIGIRKRYLINVIDLKNEETIAKGIQILECGPKIYEGVTQWCNEKWGDPLDLETGRNLSIIKTIPPSGDASRTDYKVEPDPERTSIIAKLPKNWKEQLSKIESTIPAIKSYEEIKASLEGNTDYGSGELDTEGGAEVPGTESVPSQTEVATEVAAKVEEKQNTVGADGKPECFSKLYSSRNEKCIACPVKEECKVEFLK